MQPNTQTERQDTLEGPYRVYPHVVRVEQASFILLVGVGEISGGFNSSQQHFELLTWTRAKSDQCWAFP